MSVDRVRSAPPKSIYEVGCKASRRRKRERKRNYDAKKKTLADPTVEIYEKHEDESEGIDCRIPFKNGLYTGTRYDGIRDFSRRSRRYRHHRDHGIPSEAARIVGCDRPGNFRIVDEAQEEPTLCSSVDMSADESRRSFRLSLFASDMHRLGDDRGGERKCRSMPLKDLLEECVAKLKVETGQGTVEYAIILSTLLGVVVALGMLMGVVEDGLFISHAIRAASHNVEVVFGGAADVFSF